MNQPTPTALRRFTKIVAGSTLALIFAGAMVTSTGSGLSVPDWPLSYGMLMPPMIAGIFYEHGHRMIAATVGFLTVIQAVWLQLREPKRFLRILGWTSLAAVIVQGVLGGLTVIFLLPHAISIAHAGLAEIFLCINISIAFFASRGFQAMREEARRPPAAGRRPGDLPIVLSTALVIVIYCQVLLGALMRHLGAGLAIPDFPLSFGHLIPPFTSAAIAANFAHRTGAAVVTLMVIATAIEALRSGAAPVRRFAIVIMAIVSLQIFLGAETVWSGGGNETIYHSLAGAAAMRHAMITSLHVVTGAATLASSLLLALSARAVSRTSAVPAGAVFASEVTA